MTVIKISGYNNTTLQSTFYTQLTIKHLEYYFIILGVPLEHKASLIFQGRRVPEYAKGSRAAHQPLRSCPPHTSRENSHAISIHV